MTDKERHAMYAASALGGLIASEGVTEFSAERLAERAYAMAALMMSKEPDYLDETKSVQP